LVVALGVLIIFPAFYNIGASMGALPLSGMPITFVSKGGTSLVAALIAIGVILRLGRKR
jgi:rod shape determining protein RodA